MWRRYRRGLRGCKREREMWRNLEPTLFFCPGKRRNRQIPSLLRQNIRDHLLHVNLLSPPSLASIDHASSLSPSLPSTILSPRRDFFQLGNEWRLFCFALCRHGSYVASASSQLLSWHPRRCQLCAIEASGYSLHSLSNIGVEAAVSKHWGGKGTKPKHWGFLDYYPFSKRSFITSYPNLSPDYKIYPNLLKPRDLPNLSKI